jgi:hypothetical protein
VPLGPRWREAVRAKLGGGPQPELAVQSLESQSKICAVAAGGVLAPVAIAHAGRAGCHVIHQPAMQVQMQVRVQVRPTAHARDCNAEDATLRMACSTSNLPIRGVSSRRAPDDFNLPGLVSRPRPQTRASNRRSHSALHQESSCYVRKARELSPSRHLVISSIPPIS